LHQTSRGDMPGSSFGAARRSIDAPRPAPCASSGSAFDNPPAPTSWIESTGLSRPSPEQASMTSCARRWISALPRWTESKSSSATFAPASSEDAAPPPIPISMPGPPSCTSAAPGGTGLLSASGARRLPTPPATMIGL
jgi:hypothetical protein